LSDRAQFSRRIEGASLDFVVAEDGGHRRRTREFRGPRGKTLESTARGDGQTGSLTSCLDYSSEKSFSFL
jgi:hypothetical protein